MKKNQTFTDAFYENMRSCSTGDYGYSYVNQILNYAISNIKEYLKTEKRYDITKWQASGQNLNIINGVLKEGKSIVILIRPTDGNKIIFYSDNEKNVLEMDNAELWGCDKNHPPEQFTFGKVLKWNCINQISIR
jgi:hypothetical protein